MKTFSQFIEEAYLVEMRKEDKVKGRKKTPLYVQGVRKSLVRTEPGSARKWKVTEPEQVMNPQASFGRFKQGKDLAGHVMGYRPHPHGEGGRSRGVKKIKGDKSRALKDAGPGVIAYSSPKDRIERKRSAERNREQSSYLRRFF